MPDGIHKTSCHPPFNLGFKQGKLTGSMEREAVGYQILRLICCGRYRTRTRQGIKLWTQTSNLAVALILDLAKSQAFL